MLWACLLLPRLALDAVQRRSHTKVAFALITGPVQRRVLLDANAAARTAGLYPGQPLLAAQALLPDVAVLEHDPREDAALRQLLAAWAYRYSSMVCLQDKDAILLEVEGSLGLFGPWPQLERQLRADLHELGLEHRIALAPTPLGACVLATVADGMALADATQLQRMLGRAPITAASLPPEQVQAMSAMGLRKLRQLFEAPRAGLARRFGEDLLLQLDQMRGLAPDPRELYRPPDAFERRIEFSYEISHHPALLFPLRRLVNDLAAYLAGRDGGVQRFSMWLEHEDMAVIEGHAPRTERKPPDSEVVVGLLAPERDAGRLFELARAKLEQCRIPAPVRALRLLARELPPFVPAGRDLFDARPAQALPWEALRERLRARLGDDALYQLVGVAGELVQRIVTEARAEQAIRRNTLLLREPVPLDLPARPPW